MWRNIENRLLRIVKSNDKTSVAKAKAQNADFDFLWTDPRLRRHERALTNAVLRLCSCLQNDRSYSRRNFLLRRAYLNGKEPR
jgi:hypothetical protein